MHITTNTVETYTHNGFIKIALYSYDRVLWIYLCGEVKRKEKRR